MPKGLRGILGLYRPEMADSNRSSKHDQTRMTMMMMKKTTTLTSHTSTRPWKAKEWVCASKFNIP